MAPAPSPELLRALLKDRDADVRAAAVYVAGVQTSDAREGGRGGRAQGRERRSSSAARPKRSSGRDSRPASRASRRSPTSTRCCKDSDRFVRYSGRLALEHTPRSEWMPLVMNETDVVPLTEGLLALTNTAPPQSDADLAPIFDKVVALMKRPTLTPEEKIRVLRAFQVAATETRSGVDAGDPKAGARRADRPVPGGRARRHRGSSAPTGRDRATCARCMLAHHMAKVLAYTGEPDVIDKILAVMPKGNDDQPGQIDYMYALRMIDRAGPRRRSSR